MTMRACACERPRYRVNFVHVDWISLFHQAYETSSTKCWNAQERNRTGTGTEVIVVRSTDVDAVKIGFTKADLVSCNKYKDESSTRRGPRQAY